MKRTEIKNVEKIDVSLRLYVEKKNETIADVLAYSTRSSYARCILYVNKLSLNILLYNKMRDMHTIGYNYT